MEQYSESEMDRHHYSTTTTQFLWFREQLDQNTNLLQSLVKLSHDITLQSKRIIFLLHRYI
jgi:predicted translin family RNA/ssDNA-binding protein